MVKIKQVKVDFQDETISARTAIPFHAIIDKSIKDFNIKDLENILVNSIDMKTTFNNTTLNDNNKEYFIPELAMYTPVFEKKNKNIHLINGYLFFNDAVVHKGSEFSLKDDILELTLESEKYIEDDVYINLIDDDNIEFIFIDNYHSYDKDTTVSITHQIEAILQDKFNYKEFDRVVNKFEDDFDNAKLLKINLDREIIQDAVITNRRPIFIKKHADLDLLEWNHRLSQFIEIDTEKWSGGDTFLIIEEIERISEFNENGTHFSSTFSETELNNSEPLLKSMNADTNLLKDILTRIAHNNNFNYTSKLFNLELKEEFINNLEYIKDNGIRTIDEAKEVLL